MTKAKWVLFGVYRLGSKEAERRHEAITRHMPGRGQVRYPLSHKFTIEAESEAEALAAGEREWFGKVLPRLRTSRMLQVIEEAEQGDYSPARWRVALGPQPARRT
jgi:hypothetical protein